MKKILAAILIVSIPCLTFGGMAIFEKSTGLLFEKIITTIVTNTVDGVDTATTNTATAWQKIHPQIRWEPTVVMGQQVYAPIDWTVYDVCSFDASSDNPQTTGDLTGVVAVDVSGQIAKAAAVAASIVTHRLTAQSNLVALAQSVGVTNVPVDNDAVVTLLYELKATNPTQAADLLATYQMWVTFYTLNGGNARAIGTSK